MASSNVLRAAVCMYLSLYYCLYYCLYYQLLESRCMDVSQVCVCFNHINTNTCRHTCVLLVCQSHVCVSIIYIHTCVCTPVVCVLQYIFTHTRAHIHMYCMCIHQSNMLFTGIHYLSEYIIYMHTYLQMYCTCIHQSNTCICSNSIYAHMHT